MIAFLGNAYLLAVTLIMAVNRVGGNTVLPNLMKRIHKVKTAVIVKDTIPDEKIEILRNNCNNLRDRAMIDFLLSTGIRVDELVRLNIDDIDFSERECVVYGKGTKRGKHILRLRPKFIC